jgi:hypothetical protein
MIAMMMMNEASERDERHVKREVAKKSSIGGNKYLDYLWEHACSQATLR